MLIYRDFNLCAAGVGGGGFAVERPLLHRLWLTFRELTDKQIKAITRELAQKKDKKEKDPLLRCKSCENTITSIEHRISVAGQHRHTFKNPAGLLYEIGCFSVARGCFNTGQSTGEYTWFPGYEWCYALCSRCFLHIGWQYESGDNRFHGLILDRLKVAGQGA